MSRLAVHLCLLALNLQKQKNKCIFYSARNSNSWHHPNMNGPITGHFHQQKDLTLYRQHIWTTMKLPDGLAVIVLSINVFVVSYFDFRLLSSV